MEKWSQQQVVLEECCANLQEWRYFTRTSIYPCPPPTPRGASQKRYLSEVLILYKLKELDLIVITTKPSNRYDCFTK